MLPLEGLVILDLARVLACPFASMILAELGATVIKVEQPGAGDETRTFEPQLAVDSAYYFACNRSKSSITVNLRSKEGQQVIRDLAAKADVFVENFPSGTFKRYGLDYATLSALNPKLVYLSCTGFGQTGPYKNKKGYDTVFQAMGGLMSLTGEKGGGPVKPGLPVADLTSGLWVAIAILASLAGAEKTGKGCYVDFSMLDGQVSLLTLAAARYFALGEVPPRLGTEHPGRVPTATFCCSDGKYLHITASDQHWAPLCRALGLEAWGADPKFADNAKRVEHRNEIMPKLTQAIVGVEARRVDCSARRGGGSGRARQRRGGDPQRPARRRARAHREFDYPGVGVFKALGLPYKFEGFEDPKVGTPPTLGQHTEEVLRTRLGYSAEKIAQLREAKAL